MPAERPRLGLGALVGARRECRHEIADPLPRPLAGEADDRRLLFGEPKPSLPIANALVALQALALGPQSSDLVGERHRAPRNRDRRVVLARSRRAGDPRRGADEAPAPASRPGTRPPHPAAQTPRPPGGGPPGA